MTGKALKMDALMKRADAAERRGLQRTADDLRAEAERVDYDMWDANPRNTSPHR